MSIDLLFLLFNTKMTRQVAGGFLLAASVETPRWALLITDQQFQPGTKKNPKESLTLCCMVISAWSRGSPGNLQRLQNSACGLKGGTGLGTPGKWGLRVFLGSFVPQCWV